jgi:hypothetical protein
MCLHRDPALVIPLHRVVVLCPFSFCALEPCMPSTSGLHILQGSSPDWVACSTVSFWDTFSTIRQEARWYFLPLGVL